MKKKEPAVSQHAPFSDSDKRRLRIQLQLWKPGLSKFLTGEEFDALIGWYDATLDGATFGDSWRNYEVQYLGWPLDWQTKPLPAGWYVKNTYATGIKTPESPDKPVLLCGIRVHYKRSRAFVEILLIGGHNSLDSIQNVQLCKSPADLAKVVEGFKLFKVMQQQQRGPRSEYADKQMFVDRFIQAYVNYCLQAGCERCSIEKVAERMRISRTHWYTLVRRHGFDPEELKHQARLRLAESLSNPIVENRVYRFSEKDEGAIT